MGTWVPSRGHTWRVTSNRDIEAALRFHSRTRYWPDPEGITEYGELIGEPPDLEPGMWMEDDSIRPEVFKVYEELAPIEIPSDFGPPGKTSLVDREALARIAFHVNGLGRRWDRGDRVIQFRMAAATGARYHLEFYFICGDLADLPAGVYHYSAHDHSFRCLREGDFRGALTDATGGESSVASAPTTLAVTSTFWRNSWRYKARAYRHAYWDAGTSLAHVLGVADGIGLATKVVLGYVDEKVNDLLGVDGEHEACVALCTLGIGESPAPLLSAVRKINPKVKPLSATEVPFEEILRMHDASALRTSEEAAAWRENPLPAKKADPSGELIPLRPLASTEEIAVEELVRRRRSTRRYDKDVAVPFEIFSTLLTNAAAGLVADFTGPLHEQYLIVNAVEGLAPGIYRYHPSLTAVELVELGEFRAEAEHIAVNQEYCGNAHVNAYYLADLTRVLGHYGNRGYRAAQLESAIQAGKLHLATHALGLGACGSTSFDDEVIDLFSPSAVGLDYMFVTVFGIPRRRKT